MHNPCHNVPLTCMRLMALYKIVLNDRLINKKLNMPINFYQMTDI